MHVLYLTYLARSAVRIKKIPEARRRTTGVHVPVPVRHEVPEEPVLQRLLVN